MRHEGFVSVKGFVMPVASAVSVIVTLLRLVLPVNVVL